MSSSRRARLYGYFPVAKGGVGEVFPTGSVSLASEERVSNAPNVSIRQFAVLLSQTLS